MSKAYPSRLEHIITDGFEYLQMADRCNKTLPDTSAVYCFVEHDIFKYERIEVVYVGKTSRICSRLKYPHKAEHERESSLSCYVLLTEMQDELEIDFIKRYKPALNIRHNGK